MYLIFKKFLAGRLCNNVRFANSFAANHVNGHRMSRYQCVLILVEAETAQFVLKNVQEKRMSEHLENLK